LLYIFYRQYSSLAVFIGTGDAVIEENNLKLAEINARRNAIKNSIYNYLKNKLSTNDAFPEITTELF